MICLSCGREIVNTSAMVDRDFGRLVFCGAECADNWERRCERRERYDERESSP